MTMRKVSLLIVLILIIGLIPQTSGRAVEKPLQRDIFLYDYFSKILSNFELSLKYALINESYGLELANATLNELEMIRIETMYYQEKGINSTIMNVLPPFYEFSQELKSLNELMLQFYTNPTPTTTAGIKGTLFNMKNLLDRIDSLELMNGTQTLKFDTRKVRKYLQDIGKLVSTKPPSGRFEIGVSDSEPILYQTVTIFGSCPNNDTVTIVITKGNSTLLLAVNPQNGFFSTNYNFQELGTYTIYANQGEAKSNTINITVRKIPSIFLVENVYSTFLNKTLTISGKLVDYYGNPLGDREITIENKILRTRPDGTFSKSYHSSQATRFQVLLKFKGDQLHTETSKTITIEFKRFPVKISLDGTNSITLGKKASFNGSMTPHIDTPLTVYINETPKFNVTPKNGTFSFTITPKNPGHLKIYVKFTGNDMYESATSNVILLRITPSENPLIRYAALTTLFLLLIFGFIVTRKKKEPATTIPERILEPSTPKTEIKEKTKPKIPEDVGEAYRLLREKLRETFGINESLTPREVLRILHNWELYYDLEVVTKLHEKAVYGEMSLSDEETFEFMARMKRLLKGENDE